jgi:hypothetical protein
VSQRCWPACPRRTGRLSSSQSTRGLRKRRWQSGWDCPSLGRNRVCSRRERNSKRCSWPAAISSSTAGARSSVTNPTVHAVRMVARVTTVHDLPHASCVLLQTGASVGMRQYFGAVPAGRCYRTGRTHTTHRERKDHDDTETDTRSGTPTGGIYPRCTDDPGARLLRHGGPGHERRLLWGASNEHTAHEGHCIPRVLLWRVNRIGGASNSTFWRLLWRTPREHRNVNRRPTSRLLLGLIPDHRQEKSHDTRLSAALPTTGPRAGGSV